MADLHIDRIVTMAAVRQQLKDHREAARIWYSPKSCWWTHHRGHVHLAPENPVEIASWESFLDAAEANPAHYGAHGIDTFMAAHHSNCRDPRSGAPADSPRWEDYSAGLDRLLAEEGALKR